MGMMIRWISAGHALLLLSSVIVEPCVFFSRHALSIRRCTQCLVEILEIQRWTWTKKQRLKAAYQYGWESTYCVDGSKQLMLRLLLGRELKKAPFLWGITSEISTTKFSYFRLFCLIEFFLCSPLYFLRVSCFLHPTLQSRGDEQPMSHISATSRKHAR